MAEQLELVEPNPHWMRRLTSPGLFTKRYLEHGPGCQVDIHRRYRDYLAAFYKELGRDLPPGRRGTYHSFCQLFRHVRALKWVEATGKIEMSRMQKHYDEAPPRVFYELTAKGRKAKDSEWRDPITALYGYSSKKRSGTAS
ncbi:hypothetical protein M1N88_03620 [Dehalococcoidia bacterium]|nr:hypothetical protein [Dehalococcoidia bacterium]